MVLAMAGSAAAGEEEGQSSRKSASVRRARTARCSSNCRPLPWRPWRRFWSPLPRGRSPQAPPRPPGSPGCAGRMPDGQQCCQSCGNCSLDVPAMDFASTDTVLLRCLFLRVGLTATRCGSGYCGRWRSCSARSRGLEWRFIEVRLGGAFLLSLAALV